MRGTFQPRFLSHMRKKAPLTVERKNTKGGFASEQTSHPSLPRGARNLVRFVVPPFPARIASLDSRGSPFFGIPLKRPRRGCCPFLDFPRSLVCADVNYKTMKRDADAYQIDRRGSRNTRRLSRLPYVKYSTGANITTCVVCRALRKPDLTVARRAFLDRRCNDNT